MSAMEYNRSPISIREGHAFIDGVEVLDNVNFKVVFTPDVWTGKQVGDKSESSRWMGYKIAGTMTRRRSTPFLKEKIQEYMETGRTPELTIQGINDDPGSDYFDEYGTDTVTYVGCVLTGDLQLTVLDGEGQQLDDPISFNCRDVVF